MCSKGNSRQRKGQVIHFSPDCHTDRTQATGRSTENKASSPAGLVPIRVYSIALAPGFLDCEARIERATSTDTVVSCTGEKAYQGPNQKFVYDIRAKALVSRFEYQPFPMMRV